MPVGALQLFLYRMRRDADQGGTGFLAAFHNHRSGADVHVVRNGHIANDFRTCADVYVAAKHRGSTAYSVAANAGLGVDGAVFSHHRIAGNDHGAVVPDMQAPGAGSGVDLKSQAAAQIIFSPAPEIGSELVCRCFLPAQEGQILPDQVVVLMGNHGSQIVQLIPELQFLFVRQSRIHGTASLLAPYCSAFFRY